MTERELVEIEARMEAELATGAWPDDEPDLEFHLVRDEMPRLIAEVRRLRAEVQAWRDGVAGVDRRLADEMLDRARRARGERRPVGELGHGSLLEALQEELASERRRR